MKSILKVLLFTLIVNCTGFYYHPADASDNSIPSEACSYSLYWTNSQGGILIDSIEAKLKTTYKANLVFEGSGCSNFSTFFKGVYPGGKEQFGICYDVTSTNNTFGASVYFDMPGTYSISAAVFFASTNCSRNNQNKDVQITALAQAAIVVISGEAASVTDKTATISWKTDQPAEATVWLRQKNDPSQGSKPPGTTGSKMVFNNLSPATDYLYTVYATTDGWKTNAQGSGYSFKTNPAGSTTPTNTSTVNPGTSPVNTGGGASQANIPNNTPITNVPDYDKSNGELTKLINTDNVPEFLASLVKFLLLLIAGLSVIVILIGAFRMAMSQGKSEALTAGKKTITWAIIGLVVALLSYSIVAILQSVIGVQ